MWYFIFMQFIHPVQLAHWPENAIHHNINEMCKRNMCGLDTNVKASHFVYWELFIPNLYCNLYCNS